jgi:hypothetical protein
MPSLVEQHTRMRGLTAVFTVLRLLTPLKMCPMKPPRSVRSLTRRWVEELPEMRRDNMELVRRAVTNNRRVRALVNNRAEGNAPLTIHALIDQFQA